MPVINQTVSTAEGIVEKGTDLAATHPLVKAAPHLFDDSEIETATAVPGEKRTTKRAAPRKPAGKK